MFNRHFLTFDGKPDVGKMPTQLVVRGDGDLTPEQRMGVASAYAKFTDIARASASPTLVQNVVLEDGTRVRMESHARGDRVIVHPAFEKSVQPIELAGYVILPRDVSDYTGWNLGAMPDSARAYLPADRKLAVPPKIELHVKLKAGAVDWRSSRGVILTWDHNGNNRYATDRWNLCFYQLSDSDSASSGVYYRGTKINTPIGVVGAAIYQGRLVIVGHSSMYYCASPIEQIDKSLEQGLFLPELSPSWSGVTITGTVSTATRASAWHFKPDGSVAAAAYVYTSFGAFGSWSLERARTEAAPMCKRYLTLSIVSGAVAAAVSDTAFTCEPLAIYADGSLTPQNAALNPATVHSITFAGKRLWGVDWDADGNEIEVIFQRFGSGTHGFGVADWDTYWNVSAGADEIFRASYSIDADTNSFTLNDDVTGEWVAMHALDARVKAAIIERVTSTTPAGTYAATEDVADTTWEAQLETIFDGAVIDTQVVDCHPELMPRSFFKSTVVDPRFGFAWEWNITSTGGVFGPDNGEFYVCCYPQIGDRYTENIYEQLYLTIGGFGRSSHSFLAGYPNQVTDVLHKSYWAYAQQILVWTWSWKASVGPTAYQSLIVGYPPYGVGVNTLFLSLGQYNNSDFYEAKGGLVMRQGEPLHMVGVMRDLFTHQFFDQIKRIQQRDYAVTETGIDPAFWAKLFTRDTTSDAFTATDVQAIAKAKVIADGTTITLPNTFHIDPVRLL